MRWAIAIGVALAYLVGPVLLDAALENRINERAAMKMEKMEMQMCLQAQARREAKKNCWFVLTSEEK